MNRRSHSAVRFEDAMLIFGGFIDLRGATSELWKYEFGKERLWGEQGAAGRGRGCRGAVCGGSRAWRGGAGWDCGERTEGENPPFPSP